MDYPVVKAAYGAPPPPIFYQWEGGIPGIFYRWDEFQGIINHRNIPSKSIYTLVSISNLVSHLTI